MIEAVIGCMVAAMWRVAVFAGFGSSPPQHPNTDRLREERCVRSVKEKSHHLTGVRGDCK
jgi:hypothetical protein